MPRRRPQLVPQWKRVLRRAWSVRLMIAAMFLSGAEAVIVGFGSYLPGPPWAIAALTFVIVSAALLSRFLVQKNL